MTIPVSESQAEIRSHAAQILSKIKLESQEASNVTSWLSGKQLENGSSSQVRHLHHAGFICFSDFVDSETCTAMKEEMSDLVETRWDPSSEVTECFSTDEQTNVNRGDYFLESADQVHFFPEPNASTNQKLLSLNKVGHGLHLLPSSSFERYTKSDKVRETLFELGWTDPAVPQSMYIFKKPGGEVGSHQDSTFLFTSPRQSCLGLWLALEDSCLDNACLWVRPYSHFEPVRRQYKRSASYFGPESIRERRNEPLPDATGTKLVMEQLSSDENVSWDGQMPENDWKGLLSSGFVPIECKAGDLLVFCGTLDHLSLPNASTRSRHTFQLHLIDQGCSEWSEYNWLQTEGKPFLRLRDDKGNK